MEIKIIQILLFQGIFLFIYNFWLRKETFYNINRVYLLGTSVLTVFIPFISINIVPESTVATQIVALSEIVLNPNNIQLSEGLLTSVSSIPTYSLFLWVYGGGVLVSLIFFLWKISKLVQLISKNNKQKSKGYILVKLPASTSVFSFLNYVFIGDQVVEKDTSILLKHEQVHIRQRHTLDLLWFEILKIILWFNPFVYLYQRHITALHEYIADAESIKISDKKTYYNHILNDLFQIENMAFVNQFYNKSLIQKRITMMTKTQSQKWKKVKYLILIPITAIMLFMIINIVAQEKVSIKNTLEMGNSKDTIPEKREAFNQLMEFIKKHDSPTKTIMSKKEYIEFQKLAFKALPDSLFNKINRRTYEEYLADKSSPKSVLERKEMEGAIPFSTIDQAPIYPGCETVKDKAEQRKCLSIKIQEHVSKNFNIDTAENLGLTPGKKRIFAMFKIDKEGNITSVRSRAPHKTLELEAVRVIQTLPKMIPGKQAGKAVSVKYSLPITFIVKDDKVIEKK